MRSRVRRFASVRWRVTAAAALVSMVGLVAAAVWLVRSVESTLVGDLESETIGAIAEIRRTILAAGLSQDRILVRAAPSIGFVVTDHGGGVVAASQGPMAIRFSHRDLDDPIPILSGDTSVVPPGPPWILGPPPPFPVVVENERGNVLRATSLLPVDGRTLTVAATAPLSQVQASLDALQRGLWVAVPALAAGLAALAWVMTGRALRPVAAITGRVEEITHQTLHERVPVPSSHDEVADLARTMNRMLDRLEDAAERQRSFVSDASHELRSPVAGIRTEVEVAMRTPGDADWPAVAGVVLAEEARLERIVDDLLTLARGDEGLAERAAHRIDVAAVAAAEAERPRRVPVEATLRPAEVAVPPEDLRRIVGHLLDNAARHAETRVGLAVGPAPEASGASVVITVDDDGDGIPEPDRNRVFDRFTRLDTARSRDAGGAGLGLAVVRSLVHAAGGEVTATDSPLGGARFEAVI